MTNPITVFLAFERNDEELLQDLDRHLIGLRREGVIDSWSQQRLVPGDEGSRRTEQEIERSDIILLILSSSFLASEETYRQMEQALLRRRDGLARVIPVLARPVDLQGHRSLRILKVLPSNGIPITTWENRDAAWLDVANGVRHAVEEHRRETSLVADATRLQAQVNRLTLENRTLRDKLDNLERLVEEQGQKDQLVALAKQLSAASYENNSLSEQNAALKERNQALTSRIASLAEERRKVKGAIEKRLGIEIISGGASTSVQDRKNLFWSFFIANRGDVAVRISAFRAIWRLTYEFHTQAKAANAGAEIPDSVPGVVDHGEPIIGLMVAPGDHSQIRLDFDVTSEAVSHLLRSVGIVLTDHSPETWSAFVMPHIKLDYDSILVSRPATADKVLESHSCRSAI